MMNTRDRACISSRAASTSACEYAIVFMGTAVGSPFSARCTCARSFASAATSAAVCLSGAYTSVSTSLGSGAGDASAYSIAFASLLLDELVKLVELAVLDDRQVQQLALQHVDRVAAFHSASSSRVRYARLSEWLWPYQR
jgi:hypothetical protein